MARLRLVSISKFLFALTFTLSQSALAYDYNHDGDSGTDQDIEAFYACLGGSCCATCDSADINGDGNFGTDQDIEAFFALLSGNPIPSIIPRLVPGNGFTAPTPQPATIGSPGMQGYSARAIARWDVVPFQTFSNEINIGVVAFHINGINRVTFSANNGPITTVTSPVRNPDTNVFEYTVRLNAADFSNGRLVEIRAIAYPNNAGEPTLLAGPVVFGETYPGSPNKVGKRSIFLWADAARVMPHNERYVSQTNCSASYPGTRSQPFCTLNQAALSIQAQQGGVDGATIYMLPGNYTNLNGGYNFATDRWLTIAAADGVSRDQVVISNRPTHETTVGARFLKIKNITVLLEPRVIDTNDEAVKAMFYGSPEFGVKFWFDRVKVINTSPLALSYALYSKGDTYVTDSEQQDSRFGMTDTALIRGVQLRNTAGDAFTGGQLVLNTSIDNLLYTLGAHPDVMQFQVWEATTRNVIMQNVDAHGIQGHGVNLGNAEDCAFVNILHEAVPVPGLNNQRVESMIGSGMHHILFYHTTYIGGITWYGDQDQRDISFKNNIVEAFTAATDRGVRADLVQSTLLSTSSNNHFMAGFTAGTNYTTGPVSFRNVALHQYQPTSYNVQNRIAQRLVPVDLNNRAVNLPGAIGALQPLPL